MTTTARGCPVVLLRRFRPGQCDTGRRSARLRPNRTPCGDSHASRRHAEAGTRPPKCAWCPRPHDIGRPGEPIWRTCPIHGWPHPRVLSARPGAPSERPRAATMAAAPRRGVDWRWLWEIRVCTTPPRGGRAACASVVADRWGRPLAACASALILSPGPAPTARRRSPPGHRRALSRWTARGGERVSPDPGRRATHPGGRTGVPRTPRSHGGVPATPRDQRRRACHTPGPTEACLSHPGTNPAPRPLPDQSRRSQTLEATAETSSYYPSRTGGRPGPPAPHKTGFAFPSPRARSDRTRSFRMRWRGVALAAEARADRAPGQPSARRPARRPSGASDPGRRVEGPGTCPVSDTRRLRPAVPRACRRRPCPASASRNQPCPTRISSRA